MDNSKRLETKTDDSKHSTSPQTLSETPPPSPPESQNVEVSPNDDDTITTSTESSDTFEAWTLVMDKQKLRDENRIEILKDDKNDHTDEEEEEENVIEEDTETCKDKELNDSSNDVTADDLSDGISIISESESNGRISPHPYLRDHLQDLNLKFVRAQYEDDEKMHKLNYETKFERPYPTPVIATDQQQQRIRQRPGRRSLNIREHDESNDNAALQEANNHAVMNSSNEMSPGFKRGFFCFGIAFAILFLIGKIRYSIWQPLAVSVQSSPADLEQKINDMELQNNLMRAEIDLLNKQVKYLNNLNEPQPQQQQQKKSGKYKGGQYGDDSGSNSREGKTFKAWTGNGESLRPVEITKEDLRRPYKCPDGTFKEFAGMCVEKKVLEPNIVEQFEQVVDGFKQQSETMQTFEQVAQELHGFTTNPFEKLQQFLKGNDKKQQEGAAEEFAANINGEEEGLNDYIKNKLIYQPQYEQTEFEEMPRKDFDKCKDRSDSKCYEKELKKSHKKHYDESHQGNENVDKFKNLKHEKSYNKFDSSGRAGDRVNDENSKERFNKQRRNDPKERYQKRFDDSKERFNKRGDDNPKEKYHKRGGDDDSSKERYQKRSKEYSSKERFQKQKPLDSGEWQEKYMKHRENARKENEQNFYGDNKNWFIKRGDSRENKRNTDDVRSR